MRWHFGKKISNGEYVKSELLSEKTPFVVAEAYKAMRTNLMFLLSEGKQIVAYTSVYEAEGKTTTCINMAIAFGQLGKKVLVIDMDMRRPRLHKYFEVSSSPGLSDRLANFTSEVNIVKTAYENVSLLPVGTIPPSPSELISSGVLDELFDDFRKEYDYIFIDTPPAYIAPDVSVMASRIDGIVFVVRENATSTEMIKNTVLGLERAGAKIFGFVLNDSSGKTVVEQYKYRRQYKLRVDNSFLNKFKKSSETK